MATTQRGDALDLFLASYGLRTLRGICLLWAFAIAMVGVQNYRTLGQPITPQLLAGLALLVLVLALMHTQRLRLAMVSLLWGALGVTFLTAPFVAGIRTPGLMTLPVLCLLTSWLLGVRQVVPMVVITLAYLIGLEWAQRHGLLPPPLERDPLTWTIAYAAAVVTGAVFGGVMTRSVREQLDKSHALSDQLRAANASLEDKVAERTAELSTTLKRLQQTQQDLIQSEKLASLASMVAGIAHELNTPLSNAQLTATTLQQRATALSVALRTDQLRRSDLAAALGDMLEMCALIDRAANRANALITSFKEVAVDQVSERRRTFDLRQVVDENLASLRPGIANKALQLDNQVPEGLQCDGYPGPLGQVLTNLVQNAVLHGLEGRSQGRVNVSARLDGPDHETLEWAVADDGHGMDLETASHIFEPFYTTKAGQGGSGLGLAICHRIVTTLLAGDIRVSSTPGVGTQFIIRMPVRTPGV